MDAVVAAIAVVAAGGERGEVAGQPRGLEVYGDSAYGTGAARAAYRAAGHDAVIKPKPLCPAVPGGYTLDDFTIDKVAGAVTCPGIVKLFGNACGAVDVSGPVPHVRHAAMAVTRPSTDPGPQRLRGALRIGGWTLPRGRRCSR